MFDGLPTFIPITNIVDETPSVKTFYFSYPLNSKPGQFVMLWIPGLDQKPFSVGYDDGKKFGLTIFNRGPLTKELFEMKVGDRVGISGPYGTAFSVKPNTHYIMVAGGYGAAPLGFLTEEVVKLGSTVDFCVGARSAEHLLFEDRVKNLDGVTVHLATDDGSNGYKGYVTDLLTVILNGAKDPSTAVIPVETGIKTLDSRLRGNDNKETLVVTCGPELMERKVLDTCTDLGVQCEISIERYMKCGFGVCGQCCVDPLGITMCVEGPVVSGQLANQITEFGKYHRDKSGVKHNF
ncbi:MAG TPA: dihydroorotate dehydrogenase electron transfer subunit [Patescibacteria group bacterium]|nr:dihydroorotate dehydrogenase electron transfer subunit [Patescibacteria group bacterium]